MPFRGGCTYCRWYYNDFCEITAKQYGNDYAHLYDNYEHCTDMKDTPIYRDAQELIDYLEKSFN